MSLINNIKNLCVQRNISIPKLEKEMNFGNGAIYKWETNSPSLDKVLKIATYFGVTIDFLMCERKEDKDA